MPKLLYLTARSQRHQQTAIQAAPDGISVVMLRQPDLNALLYEIRDADYLISERSGVVSQGMIQAAPKLRLIQRIGTLTFDMDLAAARTAGIPVCVMPIPGVLAVAEHMVWQMLALARQAHRVEAIAREAGKWGTVRRTDEDLFAYNWSQIQGPTTLWGKTVGIVGMGEIGVEVARRLRGFGCQILYHKRSPYPKAVETELGVTYAERERIYRESDILCSLLPYFPETDLSLNAQVFDQMKSSAFLVNCGSGSVIDEAALAVALQSRRLAGAALDTFEWEPLHPSNPLLPLARDPQYNVILTPHTAAVSDAKGREYEYENVRRILTGTEQLIYRIN